MTENELSRLAALDLNGSPRLADVRDLFFFGAFTGLRFSDFSNVGAANVQTFDGRPVLQFTAQKTGKKQFVPLAPEAVEILERRGGTLPRACSNQILNRYIKEAARRAGIVDAVPLTEKRGGVFIRKEVEKCELVASHTARRSFATNEFLRLTKAGGSIDPLRQILGHLTEAQTRAYVKADALNFWSAVKFYKTTFQITFERNLNALFTR